MTYRIIITGSRKYEWKHRVHAYLNAMFALHPDLVVVSGGCETGADSQAHSWAFHHNVTIERHFANWEALGPPAGPIRNTEMVELGAEQCVGFWYPSNLKKDNRGTRDCMVKADKAGILCLAAWGDESPEPWHAKKYADRVTKNLRPYQR